MKIRYLKVDTDSGALGEEGVYFCEIQNDKVVKQIIEIKDVLYWATLHEAKSQKYDFTEHPEITVMDQMELEGCQEITKEEFYRLWIKARGEIYKKKVENNEEEQKIDEEGSGQVIMDQSNALSQSQYSQNTSQFAASQSSKMEEESEEEEWQPSGLNQQKQQKLLAVHGSEFSLAILNHSEILKQFNHKHGSSNTNKLIDLCRELGNENLSELEKLLYSKTDLPSSQIGDAQLSISEVQVNLAPLELLMGLDGGSINEQL